MTGCNLATSAIRFLAKVVPLFFFGFLVAIPYARAQFENGCCVQFAQQPLDCSNTNPTCSGHTTQYFCRQYSGGDTGIKAVAGGVVCCNKIYPQLFSDGFCSGANTKSSSVVEQHQRLVYVRSCSGAYELTLVPIAVAAVTESAASRRVSHATVSGSK